MQVHEDRSRALARMNLIPAAPGDGALFANEEL
jgi:hypothetical protein